MAKPAKTGEKEKQVGLIDVDQEKCNRDGICVAECPAHVIRMRSEDDYPSATLDYEEFCLKCGHCVAVCPTGAISLDWLRPQDCEEIKEELKITQEQARQFLRARRSIRAFKKKRVDRSILENLLEAACSAPSAKNRQPWHWVVVEDPSKVQGLANMVIEWMRTVVRDNPQEAAERGFARAVSYWDEGGDGICRGAPHVVVAHGEREWLFGPEDSALALGLLDLYATSMGLGACWGGYFYKAVNAYPPLSEALGLPQDHQAFGAMMVGYPKFKYKRIPRRNRPQVRWI